jgi:hypothetical protein
MEDLFAPTTRLLDLYRARERGDDDDDDDLFFGRQFGIVELELVTGSSVEDTFLHCGFTYSDFYSSARGKVVWISPHAFFHLAGIYVDIDFQTDYRTFLTVGIEASEEDTSQDPDSVGVCASSEAHAKVAAADILLQLLTT